MAKSILLVSKYLNFTPLNGLFYSNSFYLLHYNYGFYITNDIFVSHQFTGNNINNFIFFSNYNLFFKKEPQFISNYIRFYDLSQSKEFISNLIYQEFFKNYIL